MKRIMTVLTWGVVLSLSCVLLWTDTSATQNELSSAPETQISVRLSTDSARIQPGEDVRLHVEIWNEGTQDIFISKDIDAVSSNTLSTIDFTLYDGSQAEKPSFRIASDSFSSERSNYPPLVSELPRYWISVPTQHFYGGEVWMRALAFKKLNVPGRYRVQGRYRSRGFLARDINNPLLHYTEELKQLPYKAWVGEVETNSVWIEVAKKPTARWIKPPQ